METLFLVLAIVVGIIVGFAATYFTLVTKLQKRLDSTKSKLGRAKSASEDTETLQLQLETQKGETQVLQTRLESIGSDHQTEVEALQASSTAAIAQLTAEKNALENELQSLRENAQSPEQFSPDNSEELAALQERLLVVEQEHQATVQSLEASYQAQILALQESLGSAPPPVAGFVPLETEEFGEFEEFVDVETPAIVDEIDNSEEFRAESEYVVAEEFTPVAEGTDSPFGQAYAQEAENDLENWVDAPEDSPFDMVPAMEAEAPVLEEVEGEIPEFTAEAPELTEFPPAVEETESPTPVEDLENWVDGPAELSLEEIPPEQASLDLALEMPESLDLQETALELPDFSGGETFDESPMDLGTELPDMTEEVPESPWEYGLQTSTEDIAPEIEQTGDELLAELTGEIPTPELPLFSEEQQLGELELGAEISSEEIFVTPGDDGNDDLDFLLELQEEDEPVAFPGEELLLEFSDAGPMDSGFESMEILAEEGSDFADFLEINPETHGGDPFINILDEDPNSSDNDLLALLQNDDDSDGLMGGNKRDDDLFSGLESMLGEDSSGEGFDDLDALLGGDNSPSSETTEVLSLDDFSFGSDDPK